MGVAWLAMLWFLPSSESGLLQPATIVRRQQQLSRISALQAASPSTNLPMQRTSFICRMSVWLTATAL